MDEANLGKLGLDQLRQIIGGSVIYQDDLIVSIVGGADGLQGTRNDTRSIQADDDDGEKGIYWKAPCQVIFCPCLIFLEVGWYRRFSRNALSHSGIAPIPRGEPADSGARITGLPIGIVVDRISPFRGVSQECAP